MTRAEDLPADLPPVRMVTFAQSFHWMNGAHVAEAVRSMLLPGGVLVHVAATTHEGVETGGDLPHPRPPWDAIGRLIARYLGPQRRAGQGVLLNGTSSADEKSWLNPVEVRFGIIERQAIRRGIFTSVANPNTKMRAFIAGWNKRSRPFVWTEPADQILAKAQRKFTSEADHWNHGSRRTTELQEDQAHSWYGAIRSSWSTVTKR